MRAITQAGSALRAMKGDVQEIPEAEPTVSTLSRFITRFFSRLRGLLGLAKKNPKPGDIIPNRRGTRNYTICSPPACPKPVPNPAGLLRCPPGNCAQINPNCKCELFSYRPGTFFDGPWQQEDQPAVEDVNRTYKCFCAR